MKPLSKYIFEYQSNPLYSFEQFCIDNNVNYDNEQMYDTALNEYESHFWQCQIFEKVWGYDTHQELFYENLLSSLSADRLQEKIKEKLPSKIISIERDPLGKEVKTELYQILLYASEDLRYNETFDSLLNLYNYSISTVQRADGNFRFTIRPNFSDEKTELVHSQKYLFHVTTKGKLKKILKVGYHAVPDPVKDEPPKFYVFVDCDSLYHSIFQVSRLKKRLLGDADYNQLVLTVIDVSKLNPQQKFYLDETYRGAKAYYTYEPILPSAIKGYVELTKKDLLSPAHIDEIIQQLKR